MSSEYVPHIKETKKKKLLKITFLCKNKFRDKQEQQTGRSHAGFSLGL
jgi:hypothetical protein